MAEKKIESFDIGKINSVDACNKGVEVQILHPDGTPLPAYITVLGIDSDVYQKAKRQRTDKALKSMMKRRGSKRSAAEIDQDDLELVAECTIGWRGFTENGKPLEFSVNAAKKLYTDHPWIMEQVDEAIADRSLFI